MKKFLSTVILTTVISFVLNGQTTVNGGIYTNTTWILANSPYIADTVVIFPNVTLTIEPGVVVIVNGTLEIRQATLIAEGTITDSITLIGTLPITPWGDTLTNIIVNFNNALSSKMAYCIVKDNAMNNVSIGITAGMNLTDSLTIKNSYFTNNGIGIGVNNSTVIDSCFFKDNFIATEPTYGTITNSIFRKNQSGLMSVSSANIQNCIIDSNTSVGIESGQLNTISNCQIKNNGTGIKCAVNHNGSGSQIHYNIIEDNSIGIQLYDYGTTDSIYCNKICNSATYNLKNSTSSNRNVANNYWCTSDSLTIANSIYDGYNNASLGLVNFMPIDTLQCYSVTGIPINELQSFSFSIYPNPASNYLTVELPPNISKARLKVLNMLGELVYTSTVTKRKSNIDISTLIKGAYIIQVSDGKEIGRQKLIRE